MLIAKPIPLGKVAQEDDVVNLAALPGAELAKPVDSPLANPDAAGGKISSVPGSMAPAQISRTPAAARK